MLALVLLIVAALLSWWGSGKKLSRRWLVWLPFAAPAVAVGGLAVTIFGLMDSFDAVSNVPASEKSARLAQSISDAMNATAVSLLSAVLFFVASAVIFWRAPPRD
jgi:hypothetical protein